MRQELYVLVVEDNPGDQFYCHEMLIEAGFSSGKIHFVETVSKCLELSEHINVDVVLLDLFLPDSSGIDTFIAVKEIYSSSAIIVLSGMTDDRIAFQAVQQGAQDFIIKGDYDAKLIDKVILYGVERLKYTKLLEQSRRQYLELFAENPLPILLLRSGDYIIVTLNNKACSLYGYAHDELVGQTMRAVADLDEDDLFRVQEEEYRIGNHKTSEGKIIIAKTHIRKVVIDNLMHYLLMVEDITDQVLFEKQKEEIATNIKNFERRKLAMELHDSIAQNLTLVNLYLNQLESKVDDSELIKSSKSVTNDIIAQVRAMSYTMNPPMLEEGLLNGLTAYFRRITRVCLVEFNNSLPESSLEIDYEVSYNIFRIIQEFVNNSLKHSKTEIIRCEISKEANDLSIIIADEGVGFDVNQVKSSGLGILNMAERAALMNLSYQLDSEINRGTSLKLVFEIK